MKMVNNGEQVVRIRNVVNNGTSKSRKEQEYVVC